MSKTSFYTEEMLSSEHVGKVEEEFSLYKLRKIYEKSFDNKFFKNAKCFVELFVDENNNIFKQSTNYNTNKPYVVRQIPEPVKVGVKYDQYGFDQLLSGVGLCTTVINCINTYGYDEEEWVYASFTVLRHIKYEHKIINAIIKQTEIKIDFDNVLSQSEYREKLLAELTNTKTS